MKRRRKQDFVAEQSDFWPKFKVYTDGSCDNKHPQKPGGSAYIVLDSNGKLFKKASKGFMNTSNNRMEMLAIISGLNCLPEDSHAVVYTDSQYCIKVLGKCKGQKNKDLIRLYCGIKSKLNKVDFVWVKGHSGNILNEECDRMANSEYKRLAGSCAQAVLAKPRKNAMVNQCPDGLSLDKSFPDWVVRARYDLLDKKNPLLVRLFNIVSVKYEAILKYPFHVEDKWKFADIYLPKENIVILLISEKETAGLPILSKTNREMFFGTVAKVVPLMSYEIEKAGMRINAAIHANDADIS